MKKKLITFGLALVLTLFLPGRTTAQGMPVYDNTNFVSLVKQLVESAKQTVELLKMVEHLQEAKEKLEKVNNAVRQYQAVRDITRDNQRLVDLVRSDLREILNSPYIHPDEVGIISRDFDAIIENSLGQLEFMGQVLSNDYLNMTDAERLTILEGHRESTRQMVADIRVKRKRYALVISFREMRDRINNRETNF
ncbi:conjugal transfer protein [Flagellimonas nanhaiensis]|uniref:Conjugal transfer protein n=1 Tax=Flagellimonas nanhaiensis TaxID=2292706 RepID=A0A371JLP0_9FLAO|nr:conjugal transfer protein [Allomuricauda nanhaiensis]RDY57919.1 conjugal transfer protein [Allomuricauda nanhaiensis]